MVMADIPESLEHMLAAWNEQEPSRVRSHLDKALSSDVRFVDPSIDVTGIDGFEANVHAVKRRLPGANYSRTSGVDSQHGFHRYRWAMHRGEELVLAGFDVAQTDEAGRVVLVVGFFGPLPES